ncbi:MAG: OmpH family outer membrane protein [Elusimicrobiota bacterium]
MKKNHLVPSFFLLTFFSITLYSLEIPLTGQSGTVSKGASIGYVDMEKIFQIYPETANAKEDYSKQLQKKRSQIADKENELSELKKRLSVLESTLKDLTSGSSAIPPQDQPQAISDLKKQIDEKKAEYEDTRKQAYDDLAAFESKQSEMILGKIYQALKDLAQEEQITIVVDKSSILYGSGNIDLTQKLQEKVRGF